MTLFIASSISFMYSNNCIQCYDYKTLTLPYQLCIAVNLISRQTQKRNDWSVMTKCGRGNRRERQGYLMWKEMKVWYGVGWGLSKLFLQWLYLALYCSSIDPLLCPRCVQTLEAAGGRYRLGRPLANLLEIDAANIRLKSRSWYRTQHKYLLSKVKRV